MRFTFIFGAAGILYSLFWHQQPFIPPTDIFLPIATGALIDILILLSISKYPNINGKELEKISDEEIEQELEDYLKGRKQ